jgi:branched-chain amino acid aminotransferase
MSLNYYRGNITEGEISISPQDRGLQLGDGLFETMLVVDGVAVWRTAHLARMKNSAGELGFPFEPAMLAEAMDALLARCGKGMNVLRLAMTRGVAARGLAGSGKPSIIASLDPLPSGFILQPGKLVTSPIRRNETAPSCRHKTSSYIDAISAARDALARGGDDALMLNCAGLVASGTISSIFVLRGGELATPDMDQGILPGITRQSILRLAPNLGLRAVERRVSLSELSHADAVFFTNSLRLMRQVTALDGQPMGKRSLEPLFDALCGSIAQEAGRDPRLI